MRLGMSQLIAASLVVVTGCKSEDRVTTDGGGDWPEFGGTTAKNMVSPATGIPVDFAPGKKKRGSDEIDLSTSKHCVWVSKIGSISFRPPTIGGGKVLIGTNNETPRDEKYVGDRGVLMCFDEKMGEFLWQLVVPKLARGSVEDGEFFGICSSALIQKNRAYVITNRCEVVCLDMDGLANGNDGPFVDEATYMAKRYEPPLELAMTDADIIWLFDMRNELGVFPHNFSSSSPTIIDGKLIVTASNGVDWTHANVPAPEAPCLIALDTATGELLGEEGAGIAGRTMHCNWSSPAVASIDGVPTIFFGGGDGFVYSFDARAVEDEDDGFHFFPENWRIDGNPPEYRAIKKFGNGDGPSEIIAAPVFHEGNVYVAIGQDYEHGEGVGMLSCIDATTGRRIWENKEVERSVSTPSIVDGLLYIADYRGHVHCIDAKSGETQWSFNTKSHIWGSTLLVDGKVFVGTEDGELIVLAAGKTMKKIGVVEFEDPIYASPVVANGKLYVTTLSHVFAFATLPDR